MPRSLEFNYKRELCGFIHEVGTKVGYSEPTVRSSCGRRSADKSYPGDNRLIASKSSYRRRGSAPRCRLVASWRWRSFQGLGCSPIKAARELGSNRRETGSTPVDHRRGSLREVVPSTRGPE